ncbi:hypothetical protein [Dysgonomonas capnocytophagoides]|uniref:hypothetical protein n=1 Tax=Dysgonomonas capnocytophagoides TaxID=45254 RepID=UPI002A7FBD91|nr:hypothetical protein [Dysgonomonas capnocytophagoides]
MSIILSQEIVNFINSESTHKMLATVSPIGEPHLVYKKNMFYEDGKIVYLELLESSISNKNMIYSLWFEKKIAVNFFNENGISIQIKGVPVKAVVAGPIFEKYYNALQQEDPDYDLSTVYYIEICDVIDETYSVRRMEQSVKHPLYIHIDRLAKLDNMKGNINKCE